MTRIPLASEKTLVDEFALQLAAGTVWELAQANGELMSKGLNLIPRANIARHTYELAEAMVTEKARREAVVQESSTTDHSGDASQTVDGYIVDENNIRPQPQQRRPEPDLSPDAGKVAELQAANRELVEALRLAVTHVEFFTSPPKGSIAEDGRNALLLKFRTILAKHKESK